MSIYWLAGVRADGVIGKMTTAVASIAALVIGRTS